MVLDMTHRPVARSTTLAFTPVDELSQGVTHIDDKLGQIERLIQKLAALESEQDRVEFADEFRNLLNAVGSIRQYIQEDLKAPLSSATPTPEQKWLDDLERDVDVATVIGLRDADYHRDAVRVTRQHIAITAHSVLGISASLSAKLIHADGTEGQEIGGGLELARPPAEPTPPTTKFIYHFDPSVLSPQFMTAQRTIKRFGRIVSKSASPQAPLSQ